jgi:hypothetical protein
LSRGVYSSIIPPPLGGKESKGLRAREEIQRRVGKRREQREKKGQKENEVAKGKEEKGQGMRMNRVRTLQDQINSKIFSAYFERLFKDL